VARVRPHIEADAIAARVRELGRAITEAHRGHPVVIVPVLKGSFVFAADLVRAIDLDVRVDFLGMRSYDGTESSGVVQITSDLTAPIEGCRVIVVEDIVDTGLTVAYLFELLHARRPASLELASLLHKPSRTQGPCRIDYLGFEVDDTFLVGYGLDHDQRYRNLPYLGVLEDA
jgi:hypoxanthine phosphoribosyltransferase